MHYFWWQYILCIVSKNISQISYKWKQWIFHLKAVVKHILFRWIYQTKYGQTKYPVYTIADFYGRWFRSVIERVQMRERFCSMYVLTFHIRTIHHLQKSEKHVHKIMWLFSQASFYTKHSRKSGNLWSLLCEMSTS